MDPVSPLPAIASLLMAVASSLLLVKRFGVQPIQGRYASIDGLRGYLAFFVFLHHSCIWYFYLRTGQWSVPPSNLYTHFGQSSVAFFFMITGFLFFSKLMEGKTKKIDWGKLFVSRFLRLAPLYFFAMALLFLIVSYISNGVLNESVPQLLKNGGKWLSFTIVGAPNLNTVEHTSLILAGVTWSLRYEWFFYFSLPILALVVKTTPPLPYILLGIAGIVGLLIWEPKYYHLLSFFGGISACFFVRVELFRKFASGTIASFVSLGCIVAAIVLFPTAYAVAPLFLLTVAFILISCGSSFFGILVSPVSRALGEMAYSIYLLHGILLFVVFNFIFGISESKTFSPITHWLLIVGISPILVFFCFFTFRTIERPAMDSTSAFTIWLRSRLAFRFRRRSIDSSPMN